MNKVRQWVYHRRCFKSSRDQMIKLNGEGCVGEDGGAASPQIGAELGFFAGVRALQRNPPYAKRCHHFR